MKISWMESLFEKGETGFAGSMLATSFRNSERLSPGWMLPLVRIVKNG